MEAKLLKCLSIVASVFLGFGMGHANQLNQPKITIPLWTLLLSPENSEALPRRFRTTLSRVPETFETTGLSDLNMAGSGQFSALQFKALVDYLGSLGFSPHQIVVVDLREEPHAFINGHAVMWYAKGAWWTQRNPVAIVVAEEKERLAALSLGQHVFLKRIAYKDKGGYVQSLESYSYTISSLRTEEQVVTEAGAHYIRLPVTDHMRPDDKDVDQFLSLVKNLPPQACVYFHCHAGRGRTSTFMIMYDMIRNPKLSREAIIDRQVRLGCLDVRRLSGPLKSRKHPNEKSRLRFINLFYEYVNAPDGYGRTSWTKWATQRHVKSDRYDAREKAF